MSVLCPQCQSPSIETLDYAKTTGSVIGAVSGAANGVAGALRGARLGVAVGSIAGPLGLSLGRIAGALLGGLIGAATGALAGGALGELVDTHILNNEHCLSCGRRFSQRSRERLSKASMPAAEPPVDAPVTTLFDFMNLASKSS